MPDSHGEEVLGTNQAFSDRDDGIDDANRFLLSLMPVSFDNIRRQLRRRYRAHHAVRQNEPQTIGPRELVVTQAEIESKLIAMSDRELTLHCCSCATKHESEHPE
jgi:hypothetical protein